MRVVALLIAAIYLLFAISLMLDLSPLCIRTARAETGNYSAIPWADFVSEAFYTLEVRNRTPVIAPGEKLEIELYLIGMGVPEKNRLDVKWSSPYVINKDNPGIMIYTPKGFNLDTMTTIEGFDTFDLGKDGNATSGVDIVLHAGFFVHALM